jgi:hypothetical protein
LSELTDVGDDIGQRSSRTVVGHGVPPLRMARSPSFLFVGSTIEER